MNEMQKEIVCARRCLHFQGFHCDNEGCRNYSCPLNDAYRDEGVEWIREPIRLSNEATA